MPFLFDPDAALALLPRARCTALVVLCTAGSCVVICRVGQHRARWKCYQALRGNIGPASALLAHSPRTSSCTSDFWWYVRRWRGRAQSDGSDDHEKHSPPRVPILERERCVRNHLDYFEVCLDRVEETKPTRANAQTVDGEGSRGGTGDSRGRTQETTSRWLGKVHHNASPTRITCARFHRHEYRLPSSKA